jgi:hypothetical protein
MWVGPNNINKIIKYKGKCFNKAKAQYCAYWMAKKSKVTGTVLGYKCSYYDEDKSNQPAKSLSKCNKKYGRTYEGLA